MKTTTNQQRALVLVSFMILITSKLFSATENTEEEKDYTFLITVLAGSLGFIGMFGAKIWYDRKEEKQKELELKNRKSLNKNRGLKNLGTSAS
jgi:hypothetical protein